MSAIDPTDYERIKVVKNGPVVTLTLSNPGKRNAVDRRMHRELERVWDDVDDDEDIRVAVLTGEADAFCAGIDLADRNQQNAQAGRGRPRTRGARRLFWNMLDCEKPIIAKVRGPAFGLGVNVALAADIVFVSDNARLCDSHVRVGITPGDGGAALWPLLLGFHRAKELIMTGDVLDGRRAADLGLVNYCIPDAELDAAVDAMADKLAKGAPLAISYAKLSVNTMLKQMMAGAFETSMAYDQLTLYTRDHKEGAKAFVEKRPAKFRGE